MATFVLMRITQGDHQGEYVSNVGGFPLPLLRGQKFFLHTEVGMAYRFLETAAHEMAAHLKNTQ